MMVEHAILDFSASSLAAAAQRLSAHHQALQTRLDELVDETERCQVQAKQTGELMDAVARLRDVQDELLERVQAGDPAVLSIMGATTAVEPVADEQPTDRPEEQPVEEHLSVETAEEVSAGETEDRLPPSDDPEPGEPVSPDLRRVLDVLRLGAGEDGICRMTAPSIAEAAGLNVGVVRLSLLPKLKKLGLAEARNVKGAWCYAVTPGGSPSSPIEPEADEGTPEAEEAESAAPEATVAPAPASTVRSSSRDGEDGERVMQLLRRAPPESDGSALFMTSVVAKRLDLIPFRLGQLIDHLAQVGEIERRPCSLKDHFRVAVRSGDAA